MHKLDPDQLATCIRNASDEELVRKDLIMSFPEDEEFLEKATISFGGILAQDNWLRFLNIARSGDECKTYESPAIALLFD